MKYKYLLLLIFLALAACSPVQPINTEIPQKTIENSQSINTQGATASISISRKELYAASSTYFWISLDSITVMALRSCDYTSFKIKPGDYELAVHCYGDESWHSNPINISIQPGDSLYYEMEPSLSEYCGISAIDKEVFLQDYKTPTNVDFGVVPDPDR
jgi:hypothetical protein